MEESAKKIYDAALGTPDGHSIILLAHNGPTGLQNHLLIHASSQSYLSDPSAYYLLLSLCRTRIKNG